MGQVKPNPKEAQSLPLAQLCSKMVHLFQSCRPEASLGESSALCGDAVTLHS